VVAVDGLLCSEQAHLEPTIAVTGFTTAVAIGSKRGWASVPMGAAALAGQLAVGWSNDYIDRERDALSGRSDKPIAAGEIDAEAVRRAAIVAATACVPLSLLSGWRAGSIHGAAVMAAFGYNVRLKSTAVSVVSCAGDEPLRPVGRALTGANFFRTRSVVADEQLPCERNVACDAAVATSGRPSRRATVVDGRVSLLDTGRFLLIEGSWST
jgi:hypothetical protein